MLHINNLLDDLLKGVLDLLGVFALITKIFATLGYGAIFDLKKYMGTVILALMNLFIFTYHGMLTVIGRINSFKFMRKFKKVITVALETVQEDLGVSKGILSFTIPLGQQ